MSTNENTARDVYSRVTPQIVNAIEAGVSNWRMPWHTSGKFAFSPINVVSKKPYRGINTVCLWAAAQAKGLRAWRMGHLPAMARTRRSSAQG
jgi:antirestriction protein ArdC